MLLLKEAGFESYNATKAVMLKDREIDNLIKFKSRGLTDKEAIDKAGLFLRMFRIYI